MTVLPLFLAALTLHWTPQTSHSTASLRGLSVVSDKIAWATGTKGTVLETVDGGANWTALKVPGAEGLDFRDVVAFDARNAVVMASGPGEASRVYLTHDGQAWTLVLTGAGPKAFFDALKFWNHKDGILLSDPEDGRFTIYTTHNGGATWERSTGPRAEADEGAFAASGTCLALSGSQNVWFGTGGPNGARVFHSSDRGVNWTIGATPLAGNTASSGVFSLVFLDAMRGVAVGGDYQKSAEPAHTVATTGNGGTTWMTPGMIAGGYRSAVAFLRSKKLLIAVGTSGTDYSTDGGATWHAISNDRLNAVASSGASVWAAGPDGRILKLVIGE